MKGSLSLIAPFQEWCDHPHSLLLLIPHSVSVFLVTNFAGTLYWSIGPQKQRLMSNPTSIFPHFAAWHHIWKLCHVFFKPWGLRSSFMRLDGLYVGCIHEYCQAPKMLYSTSSEDSEAEVHLKAHFQISFKTSTPRSHQEVLGKDRPRDWDRALQLWTKQTVVYSDSKENTIMLSEVSGCMQKTVCGQEERLLHGLRFHLRGGQGCCSFLSIFILNWGLGCLLDISFTVSLKDKLYPFFKTLFLKLHSRKWTPMTFYFLSCYFI